MFSRRFIPMIVDFLPTRAIKNSISPSRKTCLLVQYNMYASSAKSKGQKTGRRCWKCNVEIKSTVEFFCPSCNIIQSPSKKATYFELMSSPKTFDINTTQLAERYKELQWKLHPDKFSELSKEEKSLSEEQSSLVNEAYHTLLKPLNRGLYLLNLKGVPITEDEATSRDVKFLAVIMDKYEQIASDEKKIKEVYQENNGDLKKCLKNVSSAFEKGDIETARQEVVKLNYYSKIDEFIKDQES
ncbi:hypothetical protein OS493_015867 [Desmophyllum pertusum]|uniref:J domain-containing protein n=1 Tax=Desmophyllum pertusum TaxID=174260 RepID=A0A9X0CGI5_9CNID|nr:hypothetical protein OS493_015867 [Desmophyllum pertusum]